MNGPSTLTLIQEPNGCAAWRVIYPAYALAARGYPVAWGYVGEAASAAQTEWASLVVLQRSAWAVGDERRGELYRQWLHDGGRALGYETDDDLYSPEIIERIRRTGDARLNAQSDAVLEEQRQARIFAMQLADGVTCSTEALAEVCRGYTQAPVTVVPNLIDLDRFRAAIAAGPGRGPGHPLTIGWIGGNRPDRDVELTGLAEAWGRVAKRYPDVRFLVGGYPLGALLTSVPPTRMTYIAKLPLKTYPQTYDLVDVLCCPLASEKFNASKSFIKALEGGAAGCTVVASPLVYGDLIEDGEDGLLASDADEWEAGLSWLIEDDGMRGHLAEALAFKVARDHSLEQGLWRWPLAWREIVPPAGPDDREMAALGARAGAVRAATTRPDPTTTAAAPGGSDAD
jgi:glycosyltransferase involved in cell wall biosynthesis